MESSPDHEYIYFLAINSYHKEKERESGGEISISLYNKEIINMKIPETSVGSRSSSRPYERK